MLSALVLHVLFWLYPAFCFGYITSNIWQAALVGSSFGYIPASLVMYTRNYTICILVIALVLSPLFSWFRFYIYHMVIGCLVISLPRLVLTQTLGYKKSQKLPSVYLISARLYICVRSVPVLYLGYWLSRILSWLSHVLPWFPRILGVLVLSCPVLF